MDNKNSDKFEIEIESAFENANANQNTSGSISVSRQAGAIIVEFLQSDLLDEVQLNAIAEALTEFMDAENAPLAVLDFEKVRHMSSSALGMLIALHKQVSERNGRVVLCNIIPEIYKVFSITRLSDMFQIYQDRATAMAGLA